MEVQEGPCQAGVCVCECEGVDAWVGGCVGGWVYVSLPHTAINHACRAVGRQTVMQFWTILEYVKPQ